MEIRDGSEQFTVIGRLERSITIDVRFLLRGGFWLAVAQFVSSATALALAFIFANYLPKETYGLYKYALAIAGILSIFTLSGMSSALTRATARGMDGTLIPATRARIRFSFIGSFVGVGIAIYYFASGATQLGFIIAITALFLPIFDTFSTFNPFLQGKQSLKLSTTLSVAIQLGASVVLILTALYSKNIYVLLFAYFGSYSLLRFIIYRYVSSSIPKTSPIDPEAVGYGKHLSVMGVLSTVASNIDTFILFHMLGPVDVAIYAIVTAAPDQLKSVLSFLTTLFFPTMSREDEGAARRAMLSRFVFFFLISAVGIGAYILLAPIFFATFFSQYAAYTGLSEVFALSLLTVSFDPALIYLNARKKVKEQYWSTTIGNVLQIAAIIILAIPYGIWGVIIARVVVRFLSNLLNVYYFYVPFKQSSKQTSL